jgi:hypothetical protein
MKVVEKEERRKVIAKRRKVTLLRDFLTWFD